MVRTEEQELRKKRERAAILRRGYRYIRLFLRKRNMRRISAVEVVRAIGFDNEITGAAEYNYKVSTDKVKFENEDFETGEIYADIVDTEHNRKFLASMYNSGIWEIADKKIDEEIKVLSEEIKNRIIKEVKNPLRTETENKSDTQEITEPEVLPHIENQKIEEEPNTEEPEPEQENADNRPKRRIRKKGIVETNDDTRTD